MNNGMFKRIKKKSIICLISLISQKFLLTVFLRIKRKFLLICYFKYKRILHILNPKYIPHELLKSISKHKDGISSISISPSGLLIASSGWDKVVNFYCNNPLNPSKFGEVLFKIEKKINTIISTCFSDNEKYFGIGTSREKAVIYKILQDNIDSYMIEKIISFKSNNSPIVKVSFSPCCNYFATASNDFAITIYGINKERKKQYKKEVIKYNGGYYINVICFSKCSNIFVYGTLHKFLVVNDIRRNDNIDVLEDEKGIKGIEFEKDSRINFVSFSKCNKYFAACSKTII